MLQESLIERRPLKRVKSCQKLREKQKVSIRFNHTNINNKHVRVEEKENLQWTKKGVSKLFTLR